MRHRVSIPAVCVLGLGMTMSQARATSPTLPAPGIYAVSVYVVSATATNGGTCPSAPANTIYGSSFDYPGPSKLGAVARDFFIGKGFNVVDRTTYPITPAKGVATWSGSYTGVFLPGGTPVTGTFSATTTFIDNASFVTTATYIYPVSQNSVCTTTLNSVDIRSGK